MGGCVRVAFLRVGDLNVHSDTWTKNTKPNRLNKYCHCMFLLDMLQLCVFCFCFFMLSFHFYLVVMPCLCSG